MFPHTLSNGMIVRIAVPSDAQALLNLVDRNRAYFESWMPFAGRTRTVEAARQIITQYEEKCRMGLGMYCGVWNEEELIAVVLIREIDLNIRCAELGYFIDRTYEGKGIIRETCQHFIHYLFRECLLNKIIICCSADNLRSQSVPIRLGFIREALLRQNFLVNGALVDSMTFGLLASEYTG
ncbi:MAG: GNAT family N-acetyltransferase [Cyclobacteriaceae bacterium]|nr:GNAT family N-acetyltransferase [Cyclobacteriaceae bacterium]